MADETPSTEETNAAPQLPAGQPGGIASQLSPTGTSTPAGMLASIRDRFMALPMQTRVMALAGVGVLVGAAIFFAARGSQQPMEVLFADLSPDDHARIIDRLSRMSVPFTTENGSTVYVPGDRVHETRLTLAAEGLPGSSGVGFEVFDEPRYGESEFGEQVQYHRALEGELSRTISHLAGVERARVHLVLPQRSLFVRRESQASASVVLHVRPGWRVRDEQAAGIVHLVSSSVRGLTAANVTLVDGEGRNLMPHDDETGMSTDALEFRERVENQRERAVQELLDETFGPGVTRVTVAADVSFRREERTEERYLPEESATRSFQITQEADPGANGPAAGVPGAATNLPGGAPPDATNAGAAEGAGPRRRSETRNFEISKTVSHRIEPVGQVQRLQLAVLVDGTWEGDEFTARPQEELDRIQNIVAVAAGINDERGDRVTVDCVPFHQPEIPEAVDPWAFARPFLPYWPLAASVLALLFLIVGSLLWRRGAKRRREEAERLAAEEAERRENDSSADGHELTVREMMEKSESAQDIRRQLSEGGEDETEAAEIQMLAAELAAEDPDRAARILVSWLEADAALDDMEQEAAE